MRTVCAFLAVAMPLRMIGAAPKEADPVPVLILASYHMDNPGRDLNNVAADDILSAQRQDELAALVAALERFQPTKIAVEVPFRPDADVPADAPDRKSSRYVDRYDAYRMGNDTPDRNEVYQVAFRLARILGHERVYGIDAPLALDFGRVARAAGRNGQQDLLAASMQTGQEQAARFAAGLRTKTLLEYFRFLNRPETLLEVHQPYLRYMLKVRDGAEYTGPDVVAAWYRRNLQIVSNLQHIAETGDRILVIFGLGHCYLLGQFVDECPDFERMDPAEFL